MDGFLTPTILTPLDSAGVLAGTAAMTYYASSAEGFRYGMKVDGEVPLWGDVRVWVAVGGVVAGRMLAGRMATAANILGLSAVASLTATEGIRWAEDGTFFGLTLPQLPQLPEAAPQLTAGV
jgi:hypothetical protein